MNDEQVHQLVVKLSLEKFNRPFIHKAYFNPRLKTTGGRYLLRTHNIELNKKLYDEFGMNELVGIILHELCHYHLHIEGKGYKHRDADFRKLLALVGAPRFCSTVSTNQSTVTKWHHYTCTKCKLNYRRKRKVNITKYKCGKCLGELKYDGIQVVKSNS